MSLSAWAVDTDRDGLPDAAEQARGTDPLVFDTDGDGVGDGAEALLLGTSPRIDDLVGCPSFSSVTLATWARTDAVQLGDLDGDGDLDIVAGDLDHLVWLERRTDGMVTHELLASGITAVRLEDLDQDGDLDVVYGLRFGILGWLENVGQRQFRLGPTIGRDLSGSARRIVTVDLDGDGDPDVLEAGENGSLALYRNSGDRTFVGPVWSDFRWTDAYDRSVDVADVDGDGDPDIVASYRTSGLTWYENLGGGNLGRARNIAGSAGPYVYDLDAVDLDADGDPDLLATGTPTARWFRNNGGTFAFAGTLAGLSGTPSGEAADLDGDGDLDLVFSGAVAFYQERTGPGAFGPARRAFDAAGSALEVGDLDGDGVDEVVTGSLLALTSALDDRDRDGLRTDVERCLTGTDEGAYDADGGGVGDGEELLALTDPLDAGDEPASGPDTDLDGLADDLEALILGTDPAAADSDGDGLSDGDEVLSLRTDPRNGDTDRDGLSDALEVVFGTDPTLPDSDGDRLRDGDEVSLGTLPLVPDTDGDGRTDGEEVSRYGTDPLSPDADTDGDGLSDAAEVSLGTDPSLPDTDGDGLSDGEEIDVLDTSPLLSDSDGDGVPDGAEVLVTSTSPSEDESVCDAWPMRTDELAGFFPLEGVPMDVDHTGGAHDLVAWDTSELVWIEVSTAGVFGPVHPIATMLVDEVVPLDVDGDGDLDLVAAGLDLVWFENLGGAFAPARTVEANTRMRTVAAADLDGDGRSDLAASTLQNGSLLTYRNLGNGSFAPHTTVATGVNISHIQPFDLEHDGDLDLVVSDYPTATDAYPNLGGGVFGPPTRLLDGGTASLADLDGDGDRDVIASIDLRSYTYENLAPAGVGIAGLGPPVAQAVVPTWAADMDGDGDEDLVGSSGGPYWVKAEGGLLIEEHQVSPSFSYGIYSINDNEMVIADWDGDGDLDIAVLGIGVHLFTNTLGDHDRDGLTEATEVCITGTDPDLTDTDHGGTSDGDEVRALTDPADGGDDLPALTLSEPSPGQAPGPNSWTVMGVTPGSTVTLVAGALTGPTSLPGCPGLSSAIGAPAVVVGTAVADGGGEAIIAGSVPGGAAGRTVPMQAMELDGCRTSDVRLTTF
ncbi:MAG: VCBS repeat-containing protein [Alphaproteobacteria bacterium]|nr:VCBS repeat-containing protein [Alphaproteobacteria bacterium]